MLSKSALQNFYHKLNSWNSVSRHFIFLPDIEKVLKGTAFLQITLLSCCWLKWVHLKSKTLNSVKWKSKQTEEILYNSFKAFILSREDTYRLLDSPKSSIEISIRSGKLKNMWLTLGELNKNSSLELKQVLIIVFKIKTTCTGVTTITYCLSYDILRFHRRKRPELQNYKVCWDRFMLSSKDQWSIVLWYCQIYIFGM